MRAGRALGLAAVLLAVLAAGMWIGGHPARMPTVLREVFVDESAGLTAEASELIEGNYYRRVDQADLIDSSLGGMVRGLRRRYHDRFSDYFSPKALAGFDEEIEGRFSGVGLEVATSPPGRRVVSRRGLRVVKALPGSPAEAAGIAAGDWIVSVDGEPIAGTTLAASIEGIKGPEGTAVTLGVRRPKGGGTRQVKVTRAQISLPVVSSSLKRVGGKKLGYARLATFSEGADVALRRAVRKLQEEGAEGLVLDLRGNGGGLLDEAVLNANIFLPKGEVVVSTKSRTQGDAVYRTQGGNLPALPLVVLIDRNTASAAEILTAALADDAGAKTVGTRSYGKGVFQQEIGLSNGGALKLTVGEYFTPNGENLAGKGIHPDVKARNLPGTARDEGLEKALEVLASEVR